MRPAARRTFSLARRPTTDTPSEFDADWYHLPRGATVLEATTTASPYRSGTLVYIADDMYFCHTSVPAPGVTAADIPANANFVSLSSGGIGSVVTENSLSGDGSAGDPLDLNVAGSDFPIIPLDKGGTGATTATGARLRLGLGTAAVRDVGDDASDVAVLQGDASFTAGHLAPGGGVGQVLTRTATGKEWMSSSGINTNYYVDAASFSLSGNDLTVTLPRTGGLADVTSNTSLRCLAQAAAVSSFPRTYRIRAITTSPSPQGVALPAFPLAHRFYSSLAYQNTGAVRVTVDSVGPYTM